MTKTRMNITINALLRPVEKCKRDSCDLAKDKQFLKDSLQEKYYITY